MVNVRNVSFVPMPEVVAATGIEFRATTSLGAPADWPLLIDARVVQTDCVVVVDRRRDAKIGVSGAALSALPAATTVEGLAVIR